MDVTRSQSAPLDIAELVEHEQRVRAGAAPKCPLQALPSYSPQVGLSLESISARSSSAVRHIYRQNVPRKLAAGRWHRSRRQSELSPRPRLQILKSREIGTFVGDVYGMKVGFRADQNLAPTSGGDAIQRYLGAYDTGSGPPCRPAER